jgi:peroxiredoxin (alkyl hydroperoxide reductase subunit C)
MNRYGKWAATLLALGVFCLGAGPALGQALRDNLYLPGQLKPVDSVLKVAVGKPAPDFSLPALGGGRVSLADYRGKSNVLLSFVPAAWTPVCSGQWPGYNMARKLFVQNDVQVLGLSVDNMPTLHAWTKEMGGLWFPALSDFWPHGEVAARYGVLRGDGTAERALFLIDKQGIIRYLDVHDINERPSLETLAREMERLPR